MRCLYGIQIAGFNDESERLGSIFARQAAATVANAEIHERMATVILQLNEAMASRSVIDQARGILIANTGCSADQAFDLLKQQSQNQNIKLRDIAADIVRNATREKWEAD